MKLRILYVILFILLLIPFGYLEENQDQSLDFDVIKTKYMDVNVYIEIPIYLDKYSESGTFTLTTPVFIDSRNQTISSLEAYYLEGFEKIPAKFIEDELGNKFAVFEVTKINRGEYIFYVDARIVSENKIIFSPDIFSLENKISEYQDFIKPTRYINSDKSEIISVSRFLKTSNNALKEITNIVNWTYNYLEYDESYGDKVVEAVNVLSERKGVCTEYSILAASILREREIPTRYVTGYANSTLDWQAHAWLEVYIPGQGWIFVDPTFGEVALVDASHLLISRAYDPSEIKDRVTAYGDVHLRFGEKKANFKINEHKSFSDLGYSNTINVDFVYPDKIKQNSPFFIKAKITNTTSRPISTLFMLSLHSDFKIIYPESKDVILYLEPFKEEEISYYIISENIDVPLNYYKTYSFSLKSQLSDYSGVLKVYREDGFFQEAFFVSPVLFYFDKGLLNISLDVINFTNVSKTINFDFNNNDSLSSREKIIPSNTIYNYKESFNVLKDTRFILSLSKDYSLSESFFIYEDSVVLEKKEDVIMPDFNVLEEDENIPLKVILENKESSFSKNSLVSIFIVIGFFIFTLVVFFILRKSKED